MVKSYFRWEKVFLRLQICPSTSSLLDNSLFPPLKFLISSSLFIFLILPVTSRNRIDFSHFQLFKQKVKVALIVNFVGKKQWLLWISNLKKSCFYFFPSKNAYWNFHFHFTFLTFNLVHIGFRYHFGELTSVKWLSNHPDAVLFFCQIFFLFLFKVDPII